MQVIASQYNFVFVVFLFYLSSHRFPMTLHLQEEQYPTLLMTYVYVARFINSVILKGKF